jgi:hypothetical protein
MKANSFCKNKDRLLIHRMDQQHLS